VLVVRPRLLLLDEPLSALDAPTREQVRRELRRLLAPFPIPVVLVTHDRTEAIALADRVVVMERGTPRQSGTVSDVFTRPADLAVARMVGVETVERATIVRVQDGLATIVINGVELVGMAPGDLRGREVHACIRAEEVIVQRGAGPQSSVRNRLSARIVSIHPEGPLQRLLLDCGFSLSALITRPACEELGLQEGDQVTALVKASAIHLIPRN
jgi:molybdate transport system ATP-binding protein